MDQALTIVVAARNQASPTLKVVQQEAKNTGGAARQIGAAATAAAAATQTAFQRIAAGARQVVGHFGAVGGGVERAHRPVRSFGDTVLSVAKGLKIISLALAVVLTTAKVFPNVFGKATAAVQDYGSRVQQILGPLRALVAALIPAAVAAKGLQVALGALHRISQGVHQGLQGGLTLSLGALRMAGNVARNAITGLAGAAGQLLQRLSLTATVGAAALTAALAALAKRGVDMNVTVEGATVAMTRISGSSRGAAKFIGELRKEAEISALTFKEMLGVAQSLASVYVEKYGPAGLGRVIPTMRAFADAATVLRVEPMGMSNALLGFRQLASAPKPTLEDLKQVDENLPGAGVRSIVRAAFGTDDSDALAKAGKVGADVAEAIVRGLQRKFNGAQAVGATTLPVMFSNIQDALDDLGARVTTGLKGSLERAVRLVLDTLGQIADSPLGKTLETVFNAVGRAIEGATNQLPGFLAWLGKVATAQNLSVVLSQVIGLIQTIGQELGRVFGVDLAKAFEPSNVLGWFRAFGQGVANAIDAGFGLARVWQEAQKIITEFVRDTRDALTDWGDDAGRTFKALFFGLQSSIQATAAVMTKSAISVLEAYNSVAKKFNLQTVDLTPLYKAQIETSVEAKISQGNAEQQAWDQLHANQERQTREQRKDEADPHRHDPIWKRFSDAFQGIDRDTSMQKEFWERYKKNSVGAAKYFFGGANAPQPAPYQGPELINRSGQPGALPPSVSNGRSNVPPVPTAPPVPGSALGGMPVTPGWMQDYQRSLTGHSEDELKELVKVLKERYGNLQKYLPAQAEGFKQQQLLPALRELMGRLAASYRPGQDRKQGYETFQELEGLRGDYAELTAPGDASPRVPEAAGVLQQIQARIAWLQAQGRTGTERQADAVQRRAEIAALQVQYQQIAQSAQSGTPTRLAGGSATRDDGTITLLGGGTLRLPRGDAPLEAFSGSPGTPTEPARTAGSQQAGTSAPSIVQTGANGKILSLTLNIQVRSEQEAEQFVLDVMRKHAAPVLASSPAF